MLVIVIMFYGHMSKKNREGDKSRSDAVNRVPTVAPVAGLPSSSWYTIIAMFLLVKIRARELLWQIELEGRRRTLLSLTEKRFELEELAPTA